MDSKPPELVDRNREWSKLSELATSPDSELVFVHGRRRVGKSWLIQRFAGAAGGIYYQATRGTSSEQLRRMGAVMGAHFSDDALLEGSGFQNWERLLAYFTRKSRQRPVPLVIDEFPYLAEESSELTSVLQWFWDHEWKEAGVKVFLCGSHITLMKQLEERDQPLHGRRTARIAVSPFTHREVAEFVPSYEPRDVLRVYGIFGGLPGHLDRLDDSMPLGEQVCQRILDPSSRLYDEATHVLDGFGRDADVHYSTLYAVATGAHTWSEITSRVARTQGALYPVIEWLREMEIIEREVPVTVERPERSKISLYRVTDPYLRFWHTFVQPIYSSGAAAMAKPADLWARIESRLDDYMGEVFEETCRQLVASEHFDLPFAPLRIGRWWSRASDEEVDLVVRGLDGELFVGECKWGAVTGRDLKKLRDRARLVATEFGGATDIHLGLFSGSGEFDDACRKASKKGEVRLMDADSMFA